MVLSAANFSHTVSFVVVLLVVLRLVVVSPISLND